MRQSLAEMYTGDEVRGIDKDVAVNPLEIVKHVYDACDDAKGKEVVILDVAKNFGLADYFLIATGRSDRHTQGIANRAIDELKKLGLEPYSVQGMEDGKWIVIDCIEVVLHVFYEPLREKYDLESLWMNAQEVERRAIPKKLKEQKRELEHVMA